MFNGHKGDGGPEGELPEGDNGKGNCENGEGDRIVGKGQRPVSRESYLARENQIFLSLPSPFYALHSQQTQKTINTISFIKQLHYL